MTQEKNAEPVHKVYSSFLEGDIEGAIDQFSKMLYFNSIFLKEPSSLAERNEKEARRYA
jgi:hypothetical protein